MSRIAQFDDLTSGTPNIKPLYSSSVAFMHADGTLTDTTIKRMSIEQLLRLAFTNGKDNKDGVRAERYRRTSNGAEASKQGGYANEEYWGVHRAHLELAYRNHREASILEANHVQI